MHSPRFLTGAIPLLFLLLSLPSVTPAQNNTYLLAEHPESIRIGKILPSKVAEAPSPAPNQPDLMSLMSSNGCKAFAKALTASGAEKVFADNLEGGLTVFCPIDDVFKAFSPKYKNLTAAGETSLMEYHGVPIYMSMPILKSNNGIMSTLATDRANNYELTVQNDGEEVTIKTYVVTARITGTIFDDVSLVIYKIDKVLEPVELFKADVPTPPPAPPPAPKSATAAESPKASPSPVTSPAPADEKKDRNTAMRMEGLNSCLAVSALSAWVGFLLL